MSTASPVNPPSPAGPAAPAAPSEAQEPAARPARSPEEIAAELEARRRALAADVDEVAARLAPTSLKRIARQKADAAVADLRGRTESLRGQAEALASQAGLTRGPRASSRAQQAQAPQPTDRPTTASGAAGGTTDAQPGTASPGSPGPAPGPLSSVSHHLTTVSEALPGNLPEGLASLPQRLSRLLDDARDGDPASLAIVTGAALALAGVSALALTRAVRR